MDISKLLGISIFIGSLALFSACSDSGSFTNGNESGENGSNESTNGSGGNENGSSGSTNGSDGAENGSSGSTNGSSGSENGSSGSTNGSNGTENGSSGENLNVTPTYMIGPSHAYRQFSDLPTLIPGDVVGVEGGATYEPVAFYDQHGTEESPITIIGVTSTGQSRPVISGGVNTVILASDHYVFQGLEVTEGSFRCIFHVAHNITIRDSVIHDCPAHGILGADEGSGSLLLEYSEIYNAGNGGYEHPIYMTTDQEQHPGSVFRMQFNYVHDAWGGNSIKSRAERNEIYYNWIEGSDIHEIELIGPDRDSVSIGESAYVENSDVVGNVFVKTNGGWVARFGGDKETGQTNGRYRFNHNTIILSPGSNNGVFRLFLGIESFEAHNNVIHKTGSGSSQVLRDVETNWVDGVRRVAGSNNFIFNGASLYDIPEEWTGNIDGSDPVMESISDNNLVPAVGSPLINTANSSPTPYPDYHFPNPEEFPRFHPPARNKLSPGTAEARVQVGDALDVGAYEAN